MVWNRHLKYFGLLLMLNSIVMESQTQSQSPPNQQDPNANQFQQQGNLTDLQATQQFNSQPNDAVAQASDIHQITTSSTIPSTSTTPDDSLFVSALSTSQEPPSSSHKPSSTSEELLSTSQKPPTSQEPIPTSQKPSTIKMPLPGSAHQNQERYVIKFVSLGALLFSKFMGNNQQEQNG